MICCVCLWFRSSFGVGTFLLLGSFLVSGVCFTFEVLDLIFVSQFLGWTFLVKDHNDLSDWKSWKFGKQVKKTSVESLPAEYNVILGLVWRILLLDGDPSAIVAPPIFSPKSLWKQILHMRNFPSPPKRALENWKNAIFLDDLTVDTIQCCSHVNSSPHFPHRTMARPSLHFNRTTPESQNHKTTARAQFLSWGIVSALFFSHHPVVVVLSKGRHPHLQTDKQFQQNKKHNGTEQNKTKL